MRHGCGGVAARAAREQRRVRRAGTPPAIGGRRAPGRGQWAVGRHGLEPRTSAGRAVRCAEFGSAAQGRPRRAAMNYFNSLRSSLATNSLLPWPGPRRLSPSPARPAVRRCAPHPVLHVRFQCPGQALLDHFTTGAYPLAAQELLPRSGKNRSGSAAAQAPLSRQLTTNGEPSASADAGYPAPVNGIGRAHRRSCPKGGRYAARPARRAVRSRGRTPRSRIRSPQRGRVPPGPEARCLVTGSPGAGTTPLRSAIVPVPPLRPRVSRAASNAASALAPGAGM